MSGTLGWVDGREVGTVEPEEVPPLELIERILRQRQVRAERGMLAVEEDVIVEHPGWRGGPEHCWAVHQDDPMFCGDRAVGVLELGRTSQGQAVEVRARS